MNPPSVGSAQARNVPRPGSFRLPAEDVQLLERLRKRDEASFLQLVQRHHDGLVRLAQCFVKSRPVAEEVAQETWVGVLQGIERFEGRSSLKTWIYRILMNRAKTRGEREGRYLPFSALWNPAEEPAEFAVPPKRFRGPDDEQPGHWASPPPSWGADPEKQLLADETQALIGKVIDTLPPGQRAVLTLRDVEGWAAAAVCELLGVSEANQRVLLHRARSKVRLALEKHLASNRNPHGTKALTR